MSAPLALEWQYIVGDLKLDSARDIAQPWNRTPVPELTPVLVRLIEPLPSVGCDPLDVDRDELVDYLADVFVSSPTLKQLGHPALSYARELARVAVATLHPTYEAYGEQLNPAGLRADAELMVSGDRDVIELVASLLKTIRQLHGEAQRVREAYSKSYREREAECWQLAQDLTYAQSVIATVKRAVRPVRVTPG